MKEKQFIFNLILVLSHFQERKFKKNVKANIFYNPYEP